MDNEALLKRLGTRLKELRLARNLKQEDIEKKYGFNYCYYGRLERGNVNPSVETLKRICEMFDKTLSDLFNFSDPKDNLSPEREVLAVKISETLNKAGKVKLKKLRIFLDEILFYQISCALLLG